MAERRLWYYESTDRNTIPEGVTGPHAVPRSIRENLIEIENEKPAFGGRPGVYDSGSGRPAICPLAAASVLS